MPRSPKVIINSLLSRGCISDRDHKKLINAVERSNENRKNNGMSVTGCLVLAEGAKRNAEKCTSAEDERYYKGQEHAYLIAYRMFTNKIAVFDEDTGKYRDAKGPIIFDKDQEQYKEL